MQDFVIPTTSVVWGQRVKQSLEVRGMSFQDLTLLFTTHGKTVDKIFTMVEGMNGNSTFDMKEFGAELLTQAPQVVATMIALATDMPDQAAARMPFPVQVKILEAIYQMTVEEAGGLTDFLDLALRLMRSVRQVVPSMSSQMKPSLPDNIGM